MTRRTLVILIVLLTAIAANMAALRFGGVNAVLAYVLLGVWQVSRWAGRFARWLGDRLGGA